MTKEGAMKRMLVPDPRPARTSGTTRISKIGPGPSGRWTQAWCALCSTQPQPTLAISLAASLPSFSPLEVASSDLLPERCQGWNRQQGFSFSIKVGVKKQNGTSHHGDGLPLANLFLLDSISRLLLQLLHHFLHLQIVQS